MRISDWSSDVCSSDLRAGAAGQLGDLQGLCRGWRRPVAETGRRQRRADHRAAAPARRRTPAFGALGKLSGRADHGKAWPANRLRIKDPDMNDKHDISALNGLITTTLDSMKGFEDAAEDAKSTRFAAMFADFASDRGTVVAYLQAEVRGAGGKPEERASFQIGRAHV